MVNWNERRNEIVYFVDNLEAGQLLVLLEKIKQYKVLSEELRKELRVEVTEEATYDFIIRNGISRPVIEKLCEFGMVETSESIYSVTAYGEKFSDAFYELMLLDKDNIM